MSVYIKKGSSPREMIAPDNKTFLRASKELQSVRSEEQITEMWNDSGLGRPAKQSTVRRWLRTGPDTKNPRFEMWVVKVAAALRPTDTESKKILGAIRSRREILAYRVGFIGFMAEEDQIDSRRDRATCASLAAYYQYDRNMSDSQRNLVDKMYHRVKDGTLETVYKMVLKNNGE